MADGKKLSATRMLAEGVSATEAHQKMMDRIVGPTNALQKYMDTIRAPYVDPLAMSGLQATLDSIYRSTDLLAQTFSDLHNSMLDPTTGLGAALQHVMMPTSGIAEILRGALPTNSLAHAMTFPSLGIASAVQEALAPSRDLAGALGAIDKANRAAMASWYDAMPKISELWTDPFATSWKAMGITEQMLVQAVEARDVIRALNAANAPIDPQGRSFLVDGVAIIEAELGEESTLEGVRSALGRLITLFLDRVGRAKTAFEEHRLNTIIALLSLMVAAYAVYSSEQSNIELVDSVDGIRVEIAEGIDRLRDTLVEQLNQGAEYQPIVVMRPVFVRTDPSTKSKAKARLAAEDIAEFVEARAGWVHIRYYDAIADKIESGWVYGRRVRVLPLMSYDHSE